MDKQETISIVSVCDNHYAILLVALIKSIEVNHHTSENIDFYVVSDKISPQIKSRIDKSINKSIINIIWLEMEACIPKQFELPTDKTSYPVKIYMKLFIPYFMPQHLEKIIFLDVDMIMLEDVSTLWHIDLGDKIVAVVQDQFVKVMGNWGGVRNYEAFNLTADTKYFNTGLLVFNTKKWLELDLTTQVIKCTNDNREFVVFGDQYAINAILANQWKELDQSWNRFAYSEEERPFNIHFTGRKPFYKTYEFNEKYQKIFLGYLALTEWKNFKPVSETKRYFKKVKNISEKFKKLTSQLWASIYNSPFFSWSKA